MPEQARSPSRVSAVIPVYNGEKYLSQAIESALAQSHADVEVLIIDDGSTDSSAAIARSFGPRIRYHYQPNGGLSAAQNAGVSLATGQFIAFLDCDDLWVEEKIALQLEALRTSPGVDMAFGHVEQFFSPELSREPGPPQAPSTMPGYSTGTLLARVDVFQRAGLFSERFRLGEFLDWYARACDAGLTSMMLPHVLLKRRIHDNNMGIRERDKRADYLRVFKASLDRRRRLNEK